MRLVVSINCSPPPPLCFSIVSSTSLEFLASLCIAPKDFFFFNLAGSSIFRLVRVKKIYRRADEPIYMQDTLMNKKPRNNKFPFRFLIFTKQSQLLTTLLKKPFENILGKGENAGNQHFSP